VDIEFSTEARAEFDEAFDWYSVHSIGSAIGFAAALDNSKSDPDRFAKTYAGCRCCSLNKYLYCVIFFEESGKIIVVAVAHSSRRPAYWINRR